MHASSRQSVSVRSSRHCSAFSLATRRCASITLQPRLGVRRRHTLAPGAAAGRSDARWCRSPARLRGARRLRSRGRAEQRRSQRQRRRAPTAAVAHRLQAAVFFGGPRAQQAHWGKRAALTTQRRWRRTSWDTPHSSRRVACTAYPPAAAARVRVRRRPARRELRGCCVRKRRC